MWYKPFPKSHLGNNQCHLQSNRNVTIQYISIFCSALVPLPEYKIPSIYHFFTYAKHIQLDEILDFSSPLLRLEMRSRCYETLPFCCLSYKEISFLYDAMTSRSIQNSGHSYQSNTMTDLFSESSAF